MIARFNGNVVPFADDSTSTNRTVFGGVTQSDAIDDNLNADFKKGWEIVGLNDNPTREDFNAMGYTLGALTAYLYEMGISEWNASQNYRVNSRVMASDGNLYKSLTGTRGTPNVGNNPTTDAVNWVAESVIYSALTAKTTPVDADLIALGDSTSSFSLKKLSWANIKATLKTYFDTLYTVASSETTSGIIELATTAESQAGTDDLRAITPLKLFNSLKGSNQSLSASGYQKLHGGLIIQWGLATAGSDASITVTLPISFPNLFLNVIGGNKASAIVGNGVSSVHCNPLNNSSFALVNDSFTTSVGNECYWFAIGY